MTSSSPTDERLARWVRDHAAALRGYLLAFVQQHDADDLLQEVFRKAWLGRERYEERGQERAYLLRIAERLLCDRGRKKRDQLLSSEAWKDCEPAGEEPSPQDRFDRKEQQAQLAAALAALSEPQKRVLLLRYYGEMDFAAIADELQQPLGTVLSLCHRGLQALRKMMAEK